MSGRRDRTAEPPIVPCRELPGPARWQAARLVLESFEEFYLRLNLNEDRLLDNIAAELASGEGTELDGAIAAVAGGSLVCGILASYPGNELSRRQAAGIFRLASGLDSDEQDRLLDILGEHASSIVPPPEASYYLARLAVAMEFLGSRVADQLFQAFATRGNGFATLSLHVLADNARAIRFYEKRGFRTYGRNDLKYLCMCAPSSA